MEPQIDNLLYNNNYDVDDPLNYFLLKMMYRDFTDQIYVTIRAKGWKELDNKVNTDFEECMIKFLYER